MAERVGFEPTCRLPDKTLSRRPRYDHFGTSPQIRKRWRLSLPLTAASLHHDRLTRRDVPQRTPASTRGILTRVCHPQTRRGDSMMHH